MYKNPVTVMQSLSWVDDYFALKNNYNFKHPLIVTSARMVKTLDSLGYFDDSEIVSSVLPNPTIKNTQLIIDNLNINYFDAFIAIGGGSIMDTTKALMAVYSTGEKDLQKILNGHVNYSKKVFSVFIPTNHGTGSEVTKWGTIWDFENNTKHSVSDELLYPNISILDPSLCLSLPLDQSVIVTLDALSHSLESIWSKDSNTQSTEYASKAIILILDNIEKLKANPSDLKFRKNLLEASNLAGLAFSNTLTNAAHSISYPLTSIFDIPHGIASSITLVSLLKICLPKIKNQISSICKDLNGISIDKFLDRIDQIPNGILKYKLSDWGVLEEDIPMISKKSLTKVEKYIKPLDENNINEILYSIL